MKNTIIFFIIGLFLISGALAQLPPVPMPVDITATVNGVLINDLVDVTDKVTGETIKVMALNGRIFFDMEDFLQTEAYDTFGHTIKIRVCDSTSCVLEFVSSSKKFPFKATITGSDTGYVQKYVCWDNSLVLNVADCPTQPTTVAEKEIEVTKLTDKEAKITSYYGQSIDVVIGDSKLASLQDKEIEFNDKDYNIKEEMAIKGKVLTSLDDEDFGDKPYLTFKEGDIVYEYIFEDAIPKSEVTEDEPLSINLLGQDRKIVDLKDTEFTMMSGTKVIILEGETVNGIKLDTVGSDYAYIIYNGEGKKINEGKTEKIGDIQFYVEEVIENNDKVSKAFITYGKEVKKIIKDGDDYNDEEVFKWIVTSNSIGITNQQEYKDIDEDSDYKVLAIGESICLPNNFICVKFNEITNQKVSELKIKVKDSALYITSADKELSFGTEEYDRLYVKSDGFYDKDQVIITHTGKIKITDGDNYLEIGSLKIGKLTILLDMSNILYNGISFAGKDKTYLDYFGLIFTDPEQAIEDKSGFVVKVPEERPEAIILVNSEVVAEQPEVIPETPITPVIPVTPEVPVTPPIVIPVTPLEQPIVAKIFCADGTEVDNPDKCVEPEGMSFIWKSIIGLAIFILGLFSWGKGFTALANYYYKKGEELEKQGKKVEAKKMYDRAASMLKTALKKAQEGKYKK